MGNPEPPPARNGVVAELRRRARNIRRNVVIQAQGKGQAYAGQGLQAADIFATLFFSELNWSADRHDDPKRDRFLLSVGHYAIAHYAVLAEAGLLPADRLAEYGSDGSGLTMGAEPGPVPGVEFAGGSLAQGLGVAAGLAWAHRLRSNPAKVVNYMSDGEVQEGATWEAAMFAGHHRLDRLINIVDVNRTQADGDLALEVEPLAEKFRTFGWWATDVNGNDIEALLDAFTAARDITDRPQVLICQTRIGFGSPTIMARPFAHFVRILDDEWEQVMAEVEAS